MPTPRDGNLIFKLNLECNCDFRSLNRNKTLMTQFYDHMQKIINPVMEFLSFVKASVLSINPEVSLQHIVPSKWMSSKFKGCTWIVYHRNETQSNHDKYRQISKEGLTPTENNTIEITSSGKIYTPSMFAILDKVVIACEKDIHETSTTGFVPPKQKLLSFYLGLFEIRKPITPLADCIWTICEPTDIEAYEQLFNLDEFGSIMDLKLSDKDIINMTIVSSGQSYSSGMYQILDYGVLVCSSNVTEMVVTHLHDIIFIIVVCCFMLSLNGFMLCIMFLGLHCNDGKLYLQLVIIILTKIMVMTVLESNFSDVCTMASIILTFGILAAFISTNITTVKMWFIYKAVNTSPWKGDKKSLIVQELIRWGIPLVVIALYITLHFTQVDIIFGPDFDQYRCWFKDSHSVFLYLGVPTGFSILFNIIFIFLTFVNIYTCGNLSSFCNHCHLASCVRLFFLMTITWIFGFIPEFTDQIVFHYIFVILMSLQGLLLCICLCFDEAKMCKVLLCPFGEEETEPLVAPVPTMSPKGSVEGILQARAEAHASNNKSLTPVQELEPTYRQMGTKGGVTAGKGTGKTVLHRVQKRMQTPTRSTATES